MPLRPLPNLDDLDAMTKLGRLHAIRNARFDALDALRQAFTRMQSDAHDESAEIENAKAALIRLGQLLELQKQP